MSERIASPDEPLLIVRDLRKVFGSYVAVDDVSLEVREGTTTGVVGESGSGKTTLAKMILGIVVPDSGEVRVCGHDVLHLRGRALRKARADIQYVPQHPQASFNPRATVGRSIRFNMRLHNIPRAEQDALVRTVLDQVGLPQSAAAKYPKEFSGGQLQRLAIARALAVSPRVLVCDEPVTALDKSVQAQVLNLLADVQRDQGLSLLFISHDLAVVEHMADEVVVMLHGKAVECGPAHEVSANPQHEYTKRLLAAGHIGEQRAL